MGNDWVCWANEGASQNIWLLPCCWESVVALVCAQCQLWGASPLFVLCQGELQRNWNLSNHSFLDCEYTGFHLLNSANGEQISELQRSTGKGTACSVLNGGGGYCTLSPLVNLPFMRVYKSDIIICYCYIQLPILPGSEFWSAALGGCRSLVDKTQTWFADAADWTVFCPKMYGFWQWFQDFTEKRILSFSTDPLSDLWPIQSPSYASFSSIPSVWTWNSSEQPLSL